MSFTSPRGRLAAAALLLWFGVVAAGCGVRAENDPRSLAADEVPYGLLDQGPSLAPPTTTSPAIDRVNVAVYFLLGDRLQPAPRAVADPPSPTRVLNALFEGPTDDEAVSGLRSAINPSTQLSVTRSAPETVIVDLTPDFAAVPTFEQRLAIAQIVFTVTGVEGVLGVGFTIGGAAVGVPLPDGTVTSDPVNRDAFASLAPADGTGPAPA